MFKIKIFYKTGDSFSSEDIEEDLKPRWTNLAIAKENLVRIKQHNAYMKYIDSPRWQEPVECPEFLKRYWNGYMPKPNRYDGDKIVDFTCNFEMQYYVPLLDDNSNEYKESASWIGYFENLYGASITGEEEDGWSFSL